jgi:hypothetical protein
MHAHSVAGLFVNGTKMPENYNYNNPSVPYHINHHNQPTSQRFQVENGFCLLRLPSDALTRICARLRM